MIDSIHEIFFIEVSQMVSYHLLGIEPSRKIDTLVLIVETADNDPNPLGLKFLKSLSHCRQLGHH